MRNFKTNLLQKFILIFSLGLLIASCSNDSEFTTESQSIDIENLSKNALFLDFIKEEQRHFDGINNIQLAQELIEKRDIVDEQELIKLSAALGYGSVDELKLFYESQNDKIQRLNDIYGLSEMNSENLKLVLLEAWNLSADFNKSDNCTKRHNNCVANAFAIATLEHIACGIADTTIVVGIICHTAVTALHVTAQNECDFEYQDCQNE